MTEGKIDPEGKKKINYFVTNLETVLEKQHPGWISQNLDGKGSNIISVACGAGAEFPSLHNRFPEAKLWGVDKGLMGPIAEVLKTKTGAIIREMDAQLPQAYLDEKGVPLSFDLIILRSPNLSTSEPGTNWDNVVGQALNHLKKEGIFFCSLNASGEVENMRKILENHGLTPKEIPNESPQKDPGAFPEPYFLIAQK